MEYKRIHHNITEQEKEALSELIALQKTGEIVIQPADKGFVICLFDRKDYETEAYRHLEDTMEDEFGQKSNYYKKVTENIVNDQYKEIKKVLEEGVKENYISKSFADQLLPQKPKSGSFYLLPKVHKEYLTIPKGRPITPGCGSNTERILWLE